MVFGVENVPFRLIGVILLFAPGLLALDLYYRFTQQTSSLSRVQLIVYSSLVSIASILLLYVATPAYLGTLLSISNDISGQFNLASVDDFSGITIANIVSLYALHVIFAGVIGIAVGKTIDKRSDAERDRREPWHYAFAVVPSDGEELEVIMGDGTVIHGEFNKRAWDSTRRELYLDNPSEVNYGQGNADIESEISLGRSILLQEEAISRIIFTEEDPQREPGTQLTEDQVSSWSAQLEDFIQSDQTQTSLDDLEEDTLDPSGKDCGESTTGEGDESDEGGGGEEDVDRYNGV